MLSLALAPVLAASALAAAPPAYGDTPPVYPTGAPPAYSSGAPTASASAPASTFPAPQGTENHFRLNVNVTGAGSLEGPFNGGYVSNDGIGNLPATAYTCSQSGEYCCSQPIIFSRAYNPYSSNPSVFDLTPTSNATGAPLEIRQDSNAFWGTDYFRIASADEADEQGRRPVRQTYCEGEKGTPGVGFVSQPFAHLAYKEEGASFGSFYVCWVEDNVFGPTLFYRSEDQGIPSGCADVVLVPEW